jgi:phosphotransferase system IIA component
MLISNDINVVADNGLSAMTFVIVDNEFSETTKVVAIKTNVVANKKRILM